MKSFKQFVTETADLTKVATVKARVFNTERRGIDTTDKDAYHVMHNAKSDTYNVVDASNPKKKFSVSDKHLDYDDVGSSTPEHYSNALEDHIRSQVQSKVKEPEGMKYTPHADNVVSAIHKHMRSTSPKHSDAAYHDLADADNERNEYGKTLDRLPR